MSVSYTAKVDVNGEGRNGGTVRADDGLLEHTLSFPKELGGSGDGTNPEQLFAAGWAACFLGALRRVAGSQKIRLTSTEITAEVTLTHGDDGEFSLSAVLRPRIGGVDQATAQELADAAHRTCPYSKATRGNIDVVIDASAA